jgi:hypothetical protein
VLGIHLLVQHRFIPTAHTVLLFLLLLLLLLSCTLPVTMPNVTKPTMTCPCRPTSPCLGDNLEPLPVPEVMQVLSLDRCSAGPLRGTPLPNEWRPLCREPCLRGRRPRCDVPVTGFCRGSVWALVWRREWARQHAVCWGHSITGDVDSR